MQYLAFFLIGLWLWRMWSRRSLSGRSVEQVKIVGEFGKATEGEIFRLFTDRANILRFQPPRSEEYTLYGRGLGSGEPVMGTSHRPEIVLGFINGQKRRLEVEYAPTEEFPEAIKVMGIWEDQAGSHREHIGFVESATAKEIHAEYKDLPIAAELRTIYKPTSQSKAGIRMWLLRAKYPRRFVRGKQAK